jgi:hypothetical protein
MIVRVILMAEAMTKRTPDNKGLMRSAAKWVAAPLVAGMLTLGCGMKTQKNESVEFSGPSVDCAKKKVCVHLLKKGDIVCKHTVRKKYEMELRIAGMDPRGVTFELKDTFFGFFKNERYSNKARVNYDGSRELSIIVLTGEPLLGEIKVEKTPDSNVVKVIFPKGT